MRSLGSHAKNWVMYLAYDLQLGRPTSALLLGIDGRVIFIYLTVRRVPPRRRALIHRDWGARFSK